MKKLFFTATIAVGVASAAYGAGKSTGALNGCFSVSETKQVRFSQGNLQYTQSTDTWLFAENQYDLIGTDNVIGDTIVSGIYGDETYGDDLADRIDLFGWSGSTASVEWGQWGAGLSTDATDYSGDFMDWGEHVGEGETWRTLTYDEWNYLLNSRANADNLFGVAKIDLGNGEYANGLVLLPDNWQVPDGITFKAGFSSTYSVAAYGDYQTFTLAEWQILEEAGVVFLPASGSRDGTDVYHVGSYGKYWSATPHDTAGARSFIFGSHDAHMDSYFRYDGQAVRLVQDVE